MQFAREFVSGHRRRFKEEGYDLDLSYITPRILAMGFPAEGVESLWRNHVTEVASLLDEKHLGHYMIFNLSERNIDTSMFCDRVVDAGWPDHHAPPLPVLWTLCNTVGSWLNLDDRNVAVIHCKAGKGRTGSAIASLLMFTRTFDPQKMGPDSAATAALSLFAQKRSKKAIGVQVPSQRRSVFQFARVLKAHFEVDLSELMKDGIDAGAQGGDKTHTLIKTATGSSESGAASHASSCNGGGGESELEASQSKNFHARLKSALHSPLKLQIVRFAMHSIPNFDSQGGLCLGIKILTAASQGKPSRLLYNSAWHGVPRRQQKSPKGVLMFFPDNLVLEGDIQIRGYQRGDPKTEPSSQIFRTMFHTSFVPCVISADQQSCSSNKHRDASGLEGKSNGMSEAVEARGSDLAPHAKSLKEDTQSFYRLTLMKDEIDSASRSSKFAPHFCITMDFEALSIDDSTNVIGIRPGYNLDRGSVTAHYGWLTKEGGFVKSWKRRWFALDRGYLRYFSGPNSMAMLGEIDLKLYELRIPNESGVKEGCFCLEPTQQGKYLSETGSRKYVFKAENAEERANWVERIEMNSIWARQRSGSTMLRSTSLKAGSNDSRSNSLSDSSRPKSL